MEREVYVLERVSGCFDTNYSHPIGVYSNKEKAEEEAARLNEYTKGLRQKVDELNETIGYDDACEEIINKHLEKEDPELLKNIARINEIDPNIPLETEDIEILEQYGEIADNYLKNHDKDEFTQCALDCGYSKKDVDLIEGAIEFYTNYDRPYFRVANFPVPFYED